MFHIVLPSLKEGLTANCKQTGKAERKFNWRWGGGGLKAGAEAYGGSFDGGSRAYFHRNLIFFLKSRPWQTRVKLAKSKLECFGPSLQAEI